MSNMFSEANTLSGDMSKWDVSRVTMMEEMFLGASFNGDLSKWDVSKVTSMSSMFQSTTFLMVT
jgi:surface protein